MNKYIVAYLLACTIIGLWSPRRVKLGVWMAIAAAGLTLLFFLSPHRM